MKPNRRPIARLHTLATLSLAFLVLGQVSDAWGASGIITTVAGGRTIGDGGPATNAVLNFPYYVAVDTGGNLFIADAANNRIRRVALGTGIITTVAGTGDGGFGGDGGPATSAQLWNPTGVAVDAAGNLFIADAANNRIRRVAAGTGTITTVAGTGEAGFGGDGGPATSAQLWIPTGVAVDVGRNLFIADAQNNRIRRVAPGAGTITTVAGTGDAGFGGDGGPATSAQLWIPTSVAVDAGGNLFIADAANNRIREVAAGAGIITTIAGDGDPDFGGDGGPATSAQLWEPTGVAVDTAGNVFIADGANNRVRQVAAGSGIITTVAGSGGSSVGDGGLATNAQLLTPTGVAVDAARNLFIADGDDNRIRRVAADAGIITTVAGAGGLGVSGDGGSATNVQLTTPTGVAIDREGNLFIADAGDYRIREVEAGTGIITTVAGTGIAGFSGDDGEATSAQLRTPTGIAVDAIGNLFIADAENNRIRRVAAETEIITTVAGTGVAGFSGDGGLATSAQLRTPTGIAVDEAGNLFIADANNNRIRRVAADTGIITTVAGTGVAGFSGDGGPAADAELNFPYYIALDGDGNLFLADQGNFRIRRVAAGTAIITTVAGTGIPGFSGDGGSATSAELSVPYGVALDARGNLFIADQGNFRIRRVAADTGIITTVAGTGVAGFSGDGGPAASAELSVSYGVALDGGGNLFLADTSNKRVRAVDLTASARPPIITSANEANVAFSFVGAEPGIVRFSCQLDKSDFAPCLSPQSYPGRPTLGKHTFQVTATNQFGNTSPPSRYTWTTTRPIFALTVARQGTGRGSVTSSPDGIACGATCASNYEKDTLVTFTATPDPGSIFVGWTGGGCSGADTCTVTVVNATAVTATFSRVLILTVATTGRGSGTIVSSPDGISCRTTCSETFAGGTVVRLTATPDVGSVFVGWSGGGCSGTGPCEVTTTTTVNATFAPVFTLTVSTAGVGAGTVTSTNATINCGAICSASFVSGTIITLTATPDGGSAFFGWSGDGCSGTGPCTLTLGGATGVTATFSVTGPFTFTDPNLVGGFSIIKVVHIVELRNAINTARADRRLDAFLFTDPNLLVETTTVKAAHIAELRTALTEAYAAVDATAPTYTDAPLGIGTTVVRAVHIRELRSAVQTVPLPSGVPVRIKKLLNP